MNRRTTLIIVGSLLVLSVVICTNFQGITGIIRNIGEGDMKPMTEKEFIRYIETHDTGCTLTDFEDIDIGDFIQRLNLTADFLSSYMINYNMRGLIESYEFKRTYPKHELLSREELFEFLAVHNIDLSENDFDGIDVDDFIKFYYLTKYPEIKNPPAIKSDLNSYKQRLEYQTAKNYNYLLSAEYDTLKEEDITNIVRLYCNFDYSWELGGYVEQTYLFDFKENTLAYPSLGYGADRTGIYIIGDTYPLPEGALEHICGLLMEHNVIKTKQKAKGTWDIYLELKDGRLIRCSCKSSFTNGLYRYVLNDLK
jgi:hypothetical protein